MTDTVRLTATVDRETADEVRRLAAAMNMSVARLLGVLLTIGVRSTGATFATFGDTIQELMAAKDDDEAES